MAYELARGLLAARCVRLPGAIRAVNDLGLQAPRPLGVTADVSDGTERPHPLYCRAASEVHQPSNAGIWGPSAGLQLGLGVLAERMRSAPQTWSGPQRLAVTHGASCSAERSLVCVEVLRFR